MFSISILHNVCNAMAQEISCDGYTRSELREYSNLLQDSFRILQFEPKVEQNIKIRMSIIFLC